MKKLLISYRRECYRLKESSAIPRRENRETASREGKLEWLEDEGERRGLTLCNPPPDLPEEIYHRFPTRRSSSPCCRSTTKHGFIRRQFRYHGPASIVSIFSPYTRTLSAT